ncbi:MAG: dihydroorotate dehydrogenase electron transfer subunit [Lachnospiraceae bacterium]|nr:dihydroorotate dehydrogenase electron transfer subunit [Lachnospiraceae bacterium]
MANVGKVSAKIVSAEQLSEGIYSMWIEHKEMAVQAKPGQFISVYCTDGAKLLPRPISICDIDKEQGRLRMVYRVAGAGTKEISQKQAGDSIEVMGPLGNGYDLSEVKQAVLIGGGIGIPPMLALAKALSCEKTIVLGYRDAKTFLLDEFEACGKVVISTDDGSLGTKGNALDAIRANGVTGDMIFSCGPTPMLKGVKAFATEQGIAAQLSLEERMACGIGACLACVCQSKEVDHHTHVHNKRVCKDGPVFWAEEIEL